MADASWDAVNTFICQRRGGVKTAPEQCRELRSRPEAPDGATGLSEEQARRYKPEACRSCKSWEGQIRLVEQKRRMAKAQPAEPEAARSGDQGAAPSAPVEIPKGHVLCKECGEIEKHGGRGLGVRCYQRLRKAGTLDDKYPAAPAGEVPPREKNLLRRHDLEPRAGEGLPRSACDRATLSLCFPLPVTRQRVDQLINQIFQNREELF